MIVIFEFYVSIFIFNISIFVSSISGNREHVDTVLQLTECNFDIQTDVSMIHESSTLLTLSCSGKDLARVLHGTRIEFSNISAKCWRHMTPNS